MKLMYVKLKNYIGIYNGTGKNEIEIQFGNSKNPIIAIKGSNGSGKSTLLKALSPFPDENYNFIPGLQASKSISYNLNGIQYDIAYIHDVKQDGSRGITKGFIYKNGEQLNPNGNISSCKELIFNLFCLDNNFISLSQLSSEDRGLADKKPAERKKYINSILENLNVYNSMYKILSKKSSYLKSTINSINAKIASIGNKESLLNELNSVNKQILCTTEIRDNLITNIGVLQEKYSRLNGENVHESMNALQTESNQLKAKIDSLVQKGIDKLDLENQDRLIKNTKDYILTYNNRVKNFRDEYEKYICELSEVEKTISALNIEYDSINVSNMVDITDKSLELKKNEVESLKTTIDEIGLGYDSTKISNIIEVLNSVYDNVSMYFHSDVKYNANSINIKDIKNWIKGYIEDKEESEKQIIILDQLIERKQRLESRINILEKRPKNCKNNNCPFIKDALESKKEYDSLQTLDLYKSKLQDYMTLSNNLSEKISLINEYYDVISVIQFNFAKIMTITKDIESIKSAVDFTPLTDNDTFTHSVLNGSLRSYRDKIEFLISSLSYIQAYNTLYENYNIMNENFIKYNNDIKKAERVKYELDNAYEKRDELKELIDYNKGEMDNSQSMLVYNTSVLKSLEEKYQCILIYNDLITRYNNIQQKISEIENNYTESKKIKEQITELINDRNCNSDILNELQETKSKLAYALTMFDNYTKELAAYDLEYNKVEKVKYYTSPTTGIQTVFMETYMNNIISMANTLLEYMFNGEYRLLPFIINETEFRIPCAGSGYINDDISSMSTSQICMISMILSFAILYHASSEYNILRLDEIDGGLDTHNRLQFIRLLEELMKILACEQCIMISHNSEMSTENVDFILLSKGYDTSNCNIIYQV